MIRKSYVDSSGGQIHVRSKAGAGTPIIFFHQTASSGQMWLKVIERLPSRTAHAFDTPGFGGSFDAPPDDRPSMTQYVDWMTEAVRAAGIDRAHIVGHHTGACIAVEMAARNPGLAQSLTLAGPVPLTADERQEFSKHFGIPITPVASGAYLLENWDYLRSLGAGADAMLFHREMTDMMRAWWGRVQAYAAVWTQDFTAFYKAVACPVMIMAAEDDVLHPFMARAAELRPDARVLPIKGANFEPDLDPDTFAVGLLDFIGSAEA